MKDTLKYYTKALLIKCNNQSIKDKRNQNLSTDFVNALPEYNSSGNRKIFPIVFDMVHNDTEMRTYIQFNDGAGDKGLLDISFKDYKELPELNLNEILGSEAILGSGA